MTNAQLAEMNAQTMKGWLLRSLQGRESLPRATADEPPHISLLRLDRGAEPSVRRLIYQGLTDLLLALCDSKTEDVRYIEELLGFASGFQDQNLTEIVARCAEKTSTFSNHPLAARLTILSYLVDNRPSNARTFWKDMLAQDQRYIGYAISGLLWSEPQEAVLLLPSMPNTQIDGEATVLKLDIYFQSLHQDQRLEFLGLVDGQIGRCGMLFSSPLKLWIEEEYRKAHRRQRSINPTLEGALERELGRDSKPRSRVAALCAPLECSR